MVKRLRIGTWILAVLPLVAARGAAGADITMRIDRDPVSLSDSFQIEFEARGAVDDEPDFHPLERDFQIVGTSQSSRLNIINGRTSSSKTWTVTVLARRTGKLPIPSIAFGRDRSPASNVNVTQGPSAPSRATAETNEVFLEVEAAPLTPYVQQQIVYTVRLFRAFPTANATLSEPEVEQGNAVIERVGEDVTFDTRVNGRPYQVVERRYAIYPQASGALKIGPLTFRGQTGSGPFSIFDPFGRRAETIVRQSAPVDLEVRARPEGVPGQWLPARSVTLQESWSADATKLRAGDPVTRTLTLHAEGLTSSQLPVLPAWVPDGFKSYPDQPELADDKSAQGITATRVEKVAIIPARPGAYELPAIRIPWWNTKADRLEYAELPARRVTVLPAPGSAVQSTAPTPAAARDTAQPSPETGVPHGPGAGGASPVLWQWISAALGLLWLITLAAWFRQSRRAMPRTDHAQERRAGEQRRGLKAACSRNDPRCARDSLLALGRLRWPADPPRSIGDLARRSDTELARCLGGLDAHLYGRSPGEWNGADLWRAYAAAEEAVPAGGNDPGSELEPLHRI
jgi:hypothetical protein